jgi:hypothetical protein
VSGPTQRGLYELESKEDERGRVVVRAGTDVAKGKKA